MAAIAGILGSVVSAVGTIAAANAQANAIEYQGELQKVAHDYQRQQYEVQAKQERAAGQRESFELRRRKKLALSTFQAEAAGSGFDATSPTDLALYDEIVRYGTYQEQLAMFGGELRQHEALNQAEAERYSGDSALAAAQANASAIRTGAAASAFGTIIGGIGKGIGSGGFGSTNLRYG